MFRLACNEDMRNIYILYLVENNRMKPSNEGGDKGVEFFTPIREAIQVKGKLTYNEGDRAFTNLKIKKEVLQEFPHLKERGEEFDFVYLMKLHRSFKELKKEIGDMEKETAAIPIVLFLGKERKNE